MNTTQNGQRTSEPFGEESAPTVEVYPPTLSDEDLEYMKSTPNARIRIFAGFATIVVFMLMAVQCS